jgi:CRP-like cAMP-binding protein
MSQSAFRFLPKRYNVDEGNAMSITFSQGRQCRNHLLAKLTDEQVRPLLPLFDLVETKVKTVLVRQGDPIKYVYFPSSGAYSCIVYMEDGSGVEVGTVGNEGFTNVEMLFDAVIATETVVCQISGTSLRMSADDFRTVMTDARALGNLLKCSGQAYLAQVSQSVACNRLHSTDIRFARWLLLTHDRVHGGGGGDEFEITQEFLAAMLGVHRPSVSVVAGLFQQAGIIQYSRGHMKILDRARLEEAACECYVKVSAEFERLLGVRRS